MHQNNKPLSILMGLLLTAGFLATGGCSSAVDTHNPFITRLNKDDTEVAHEPELPMSQSAQACMVTARELEQHGHDREAILLYERAREYNPAVANQVGPRLAVLYQRQGKFAEALAEFNRAIAAQPKNADLLNDMGYFFYMRGDSVEAEKALRESVAINPKNARAWVNLGLTLGQSDRFADAFDAFNKGVTPAEAHANMALMLAQHGKTEEAKQACRDALQINHELQQPKHLLAWLENPHPAEANPLAGLKSAANVTAQRRPAAATDQSSTSLPSAKSNQPGG
jgi:tetratricopeptide (TPR) repeat protein